MREKDDQELDILKEDITDMQELMKHLKRLSELY